VSVAQLDAILDEIEGRLVEKEDREIASAEIGELIMERLHDLDEVAYVRFASVYRQFNAVDQFVEEVKRFSKRGPLRRPP
jgi:transcriptional repressor NrdR